MRKLLFCTAIAMIVASPALAHKMGPSWRSPDSFDMPPVVGSAFPVCHLVKEQVGTRGGHAVYQTRQVCG
jgi:hypothetical protein